MQLSMEYEQRKAEEHMYRQQYEIQQQQTEMAVKMARDYQRIVPPSPEGSRSPEPSYVPPPVGPQLGGSCCSGQYQAGFPPTTIGSWQRLSSSLADRSQHSCSSAQCQTCDTA